MVFAKSVVLAAFVAILILACGSGSGPRTFSVAESKTYEASLFRQNCAICHGPEAEGKTLPDGKQIPNLRHGPYKYPTDDDIYNHIANGGNGMVPFRGQLSERELRLMVEFVKSNLRDHEVK
jgi:mono/diheme cytochrome c family protein